MRSSIVEGNWLVVPDLHLRKKPGGEDKRSIDAVLAYASDHKWTGAVILGDTVDHNSISSHNIGNLRAVAGETVLTDYEHANKALDEFQQALRTKNVYVIEGNHCARADRLVNAQPQLAGLVETRNGLKIDQRGWKWVPYWSRGEVLSVGRANFIHGRYTHENHARTHALRYGQNVFYGHVHSLQSFVLEREGDDKKFEAASLGCLCDYQQSYLQGRPTAWQQAITCMRFFPDGYFCRFTASIFKHRFISPEGKVYDGRKVS